MSNPKKSYMRGPVKRERKNTDYSEAILTGVNRQLLGAEVEVGEEEKEQRESEEEEEGESEIFTIYKPLKQPRISGDESKNVKNSNTPGVTFATSQVSAHELKEMNNLLRTKEIGCQVKRMEKLPDFVQYIYGKWKTLLGIKNILSSEIPEEIKTMTDFMMAFSPEIRSIIADLMSNVVTNVLSTTGKRVDQDTLFSKMDAETAKIFTIVFAAMYHVNASAVSYKKNKPAIIAEYVEYYKRFVDLVKNKYTFKYGK